MQYLSDITADQLQYTAQHEHARNDQRQPHRTRLTGGN